MATSANSIIRFYQDPSTSNTAATSVNDLISAAPSVNEKSTTLQNSSQTAYSPFKTLASSFVFNKIENLPTPDSSDQPIVKKEQITEPSVVKSCEFIIPESIQKSNHGSSSNAGSSNSFFTIPLRFFSLKKKEEDIQDYNDEMMTRAELESTALDIISDSPVGNLVPKDTIDELLEEQERSSRIGYDEDDENNGENEIDPIYETYIRYVYHTQEGETIASNEGDNRDVVFADSATIVGDDDENDVEMRDGNNENEVIRNPNNNNSDNALQRTASTLSRIKSKTKEFLKQISTHYENEFRNFNENSFKPTRNELKRKLSGYSFRHTSSIKRFKVNHQPEANNYYSEKSINSKGKGILALFDSAEFNQRLNQGSVSSRKEYNNENEDDDDDENYHISYKLNDEVVEVPYERYIEPSFSARRLFKKLSIKRHHDNVV